MIYIYSRTGTTILVGFIVVVSYTIFGTGCTNCNKLYSSESKKIINNCNKLYNFPFGVGCIDCNKLYSSESRKALPRKGRANQGVELYPF